MYHCCNVIVFCIPLFIGGLANICDGMPTGTYIPDVADCAKYYRCSSGGISNHQTCSPGTYFDPERNQCRYPHLVICATAGTRGTKARVDLNMFYFEHPCGLNGIFCIRNQHVRQERTWSISFEVPILVHRTSASQCVLYGSVVSALR